MRTWLHLAPPLLLAAALLAQERPGEGAPPAPPAVPSGAPDSERCAGCHPSIVRDYARTGMARALGPIAPGELAGLGAVEDGAGYRYRFEESARPAADGSARAALVEQFAGDPAAPVRSSAGLAFAVGAGVLDRAYVALVGGRLWFAPLEVLSADAHGPRRAALAPGHAMRPGTRLSTGITEECLACHTDALPARRYPLNLAPAPEEGWVPRGISCAACHAGAQEHAQWRERDLSGADNAGPDPLLVHAHLSHVERLSVCARCHLQGDARIALVPGERGIPPPGDDFLARWAVFVPAEDDGEVAFVGHVERLLASPCYTGSLDSGSPLECTTCHDPHLPLTDPAVRERVRAACGACHDAHTGHGARSPCSLPRNERAGSDCVACHMPRTAVFDVAHVEITDHRIVRRPSPRGAPGPLREKHTRDGRLVPFVWPGVEPPWYAADPGLATMAALIARFPRVASETLDREPDARVAALPTYHHLRGSLLEQLGRDDDAARAYRRALELEPDSPDSAINLALVLGRLGRPREGLALLEGVLARHPRADAALRNRALLRQLLGDVPGLLADLEAAQRLLPSVEVARALGRLHASLGDRAQAEHWAAEARRLAPHLARSLPEAEVR